MRWTADGFAARVLQGEDNVTRVPVDPATGRANGDAERLTQDYAANLAPVVSPDSSRVAYWTERGLALMDASGARERVIADRSASSRAEPPTWRSADEVILVTRRPRTHQ